MKTENRIELNGRVYVAEDTLPKAQVPQVLKDASMIRSESAGVFYGQVTEVCLVEGWVKMKNARRVWYWNGAASLSQLATEGTSSPKSCKFPVSVPEITILKVIEIIPMTQKALNSLNTVNVWKF